MASDDDFEYYRYHPSLGAAILFVILFFLTSIMHLYQLIRTRTWIAIPMCVGAFFEWIGYIGRCLSSVQTPNFTLGPYIQQTLLLLISPALFAATIYMLLGRIILLTDGEKYSMVPKKWLTKVFVLGDCLSFLMQASGGGIMAGQTLSSYNIGSDVVVGGLFVQVIFFGFFVITAFLFDCRLSKSSRVAALKEANIPWRKHLNALYTCSILIFIRSILRIIEYIQGNAGFVVSHEAFLYVFDATMMFSVLVTLNINHPSEINALLKGGKFTTKGGFKLEAVSEQKSILDREMVAKNPLDAFATDKV